MYSLETKIWRKIELSQKKKSSYLVKWCCWCDILCFLSLDQMLRELLKLCKLFTRIKVFLRSDSPILHVIARSIILSVQLSLSKMPRMILLSVTKASIPTNGASVSLITTLNETLVFHLENGRFPHQQICRCKFTDCLINCCDSWRLNSMFSTNSKKLGV